VKRIICLLLIVFASIIFETSSGQSRRNITIESLKQDSIRISCLDYLEYRSHQLRDYFCYHIDSANVLQIWVEANLDSATLASVKVADRNIAMNLMKDVGEAVALMAKSYHYINLCQICRKRPDLKFLYDCMGIKNTDFDPKKAEEIVIVDSVIIFRKVISYKENEIDPKELRFGKYILETRDFELYE